MPIVRASDSAGDAPVEKVTRGNQTPFAKRQPRQKAVIAGNLPDPQPVSDDIFVTFIRIKAP
jgi:hypothetical protein